jgi:hypothetical protein
MLVFKCGCSQQHRFSKYISTNLANFGTFLSDTTLNQITVCMPYGDGNIVNTVAGSAANGLNNLTSVINSLKTFNNATL